MGIELLSADNMEEWYFGIQVLGDETVYKGEKFALRIKFGERYPIEYPEVTFVANDQYKPPVHPHIYTNGHVCASILGPEWSPVLNAQSVCITMQSMLASCKKKELYVPRRAPLTHTQAKGQRQLRCACARQPQADALGVPRRCELAPESIS
ncbi:hypothetical protein VHUM_00153 [Vanrija humicola]|uniref:UBC core domain-containing protein n=1 Tax=Vanrija humicola TaxID=5417 RepID=A0A7D8V2Q6_VANHU|nr:hypothetical protein VHUM_00153 [Vanrija humicola]